MKTLYIVQTPSGGFVCIPDEISECSIQDDCFVVAELGHSYDYPNSTRTLPGAVRAFFEPLPETPPETP